MKTPKNEYSPYKYEFQDVYVEDKFNFRFVKEGDMWVCRMPEWLLKEAQEVFK